MGRKNSNANRGNNRQRNYKPWQDATEEDRVIPVKPTLLELKPKTAAQARYMSAINSSNLIIGDGPAGTGKTFVAVAMAAKALQDGKIEKIIVTRPVVNVANEKLGYTPGDIKEKYEAYFRPVRDVFLEVFGTTHLEYLLKSGKIEPSPMALMAGWSVNAWVLGDEMQNATYDQLYVLLTRGKEGAKFIISGDPLTQRYTNTLGVSGFLPVKAKLEGVEGVSVVPFGVEDIVRSGFTQRIVRALS